jgi:hypothetical protein
MLGAALSALLAAACTTPEPVRNAEPATVAPMPANPAVDEHALAEAARALLAQAETDIQRARARRALWLGAWEALLSARRASASNDNDAAIRHARRASELAQLGLEQLAYPAVR